MSDTMILNHSDDVSGTTIFADGTKVYWTEGRSSRMVVTGGRVGSERLSIPVVFIADNEPALWTEIRDEENRIEEDGADVYRMMTEEEEEEWERVRYPNGR